MACSKEISSVTTLGTCPADDEKILFMGAIGGDGPNLYALRTWGTVKSCILTQLFGIGVVPINGSQLVANQYLNSGLLNKLFIFYNGVNRYLLHDNSNETYPTSEWKYVTGGIEILIPATFTSADIFTIFPNPGGNP